jgi:hypothetical protein
MGVKPEKAEDAMSVVCQMIVSNSIEKITRLKQLLNYTKNNQEPSNN